ncbi:MAG TPA: tetratricopeptide repeat-containing glycosyltransferase family protein [Tepidisphaeraceae bacterium]|jgi:tetratricopeptide (TPR) repeat protein
MANMSIEQAFGVAVQHQQQGRPAEAENLYRQIIAQQPNHADSHYMLAALGYQIGRSAEALPLARRAVELNPGNADFQILTGVLLATIGNLPEAVESFRQAVALRPEDASALNNLANALRETGRFEEAVNAYQQAILLQPDFAEAYANMSSPLLELGRADEAIDACRKAITMRPGYAGAYSDLGNAMKEKGLFEEAAQAYRQAIAFQPNNPDASYNLGTLHRDKGELDQAISAYRQAIALRPGYPLARWNMGLTLLMKGDPAGWDGHEARWELSGKRPDRNFTKPMWDGSALSGRSILLHAEQGFGDTIQFVRYAKMVHARGGRVSLLCPPQLQKLLVGQLNLEEVVSDEPSVPEFDVHYPLMSLPRILGEPHQIPAEVPYISPDAVLVEQWRRRLANQPIGMKVGLVWSGRPGSARYNRRALMLEQLAPLANVGDVQFYNLQKGEGAAQSKSPPSDMHLVDWSEELNDFADTAAFIQNLDLVIGVDTAVAHLAGAMGKPVWLLLSFSPEWRWMLNRSDSPWYPTMRLFRQPKFADWQSAIDQMAHALKIEAGKC